MSSQPNREASTPLLIGAPPREADCFQGRTEGALLKDEIQSPDVTSATFLLVGSGGVGKTQIAAHYVRTRLAEQSVDVVVWASASSQESVQHSYAQAINALTGADISDVENAAAQFLAWAHITDLKWLVVLDDLTTPSILRGLWPPTCDSGATLVTTRRRDAALVGAQRKHIPVGTFQEIESVRYLSEKLISNGREETSEELGRLARDLDYLPVALAQSAAYLIDSGLGCSQYRELLADRRRSLSELVPDVESLPDDHVGLVTATWSLSMDQANSLNPRGFARPVLQIAAVLSGSGFPREVFMASASREFIGVSLGEAADQQITANRIVAALRNLRRLSLIEDDSTVVDDGGIIRVHGLVQRAVLETLDEGAYEDAVEAAADSLVEVWPKSSVQSDLVRTLRLNAEFMCENSMRELLSYFCHDLLFKHGENLLAAGFAPAAVEYLTTLRAAIEEIDSDRPDLQFVRLSLGDALEEAGQISLALSEYQTLLSDEEGRDNGSEEDTLHIRSVLAECRGRAGDTKGSVRDFEELLKDRIRFHGLDHRLTSDTRRRLVTARSRAGDIPGAIATCQELLEDEFRVNGRDHPDTRHTQLHLAEEIGASGDVVGAIEILEDLLAQVSRVHGKHSEETFSTRHYLAEWYVEDGRHSAAIKVTQSLLQDATALWGIHFQKFWKSRAILPTMSDRPETMGVL